MKRLNNADLDQMSEILQSNGYPIVWDDGEYALAYTGKKMIMKYLSVRETSFR